MSTSGRDNVRRSQVFDKFFVYAIELAPEAAKHARDRALVQRGAKVYYVGQTAHSDQQRLLDHLRGGQTSNTAVRDHARQIVGHEGPFTSRSEAERQERAWARRIRTLGHVVLGGH